MTVSSKQYFASKEPRDVISRLNQDEQNWGANTASSSVFSSVLAAYWRNTSIYYSPLITPDNWLSGLGYGGEQGEIVKCVIPKAKKMVEQFVTLITKQRYSFECLTDVADSSPLMTAKIGKNICNNDAEKHRLDELMERGAERAAVLGQCFVSCIWSQDEGEMYGVGESNNAMYSGGNVIQLHDVHDVVYDWSVESFHDLDWVLIKRPTNRWKLVAKYPDLKDEILSLPSIKEVRQTLPNLNFLSRYDNSDMIYQYEFYHKPCPQLPSGRMMIYGSADTPFVDSENIYGCIPVEPIIFRTIFGTGLGYPFLTDLLPAQEMLDHNISVIATNHSAFGLQSVLVPKGSDISVSDVSKGTNFIEYTPQNAEGGGKPEALMLANTSPEIANFVTMMDNYLSDLSMINDTLRGKPPSNVTSGAMAATLSANALEFLSSASKAVTLCVEGLMNQVIKNYQKFATIDQIVDICGEGNISYAKQFKQENLKSIRRVKAKTQSPLLNSVAGRLQLADNLLAQGMISDPRKYYMLVEGAPVDILFKGDLAEEIAVQTEIDALLEGKNVYPIITDNHILYIKAYKEILDNAYVRAQPQMSQMITQLMMTRLNMEMSMDPVLKSILRGTPMPQPMQGGNPKQSNSQLPTGEPQPAQPAQPAKPVM